MKMQLGLVALTLAACGGGPETVADTHAHSSYGWIRHYDPNVRLQTRTGRNLQWNGPTWLASDFYQAPNLYPPNPGQSSSGDPITWGEPLAIVIETGGGGMSFPQYLETPSTSGQPLSNAGGPSAETTWRFLDPSGSARPNAPIRCGALVAIATLDGRYITDLPHTDAGYHNTVTVASPRWLATGELDGTQIFKTSCYGYQPREEL
ncbi:MAG: hypothetical protein RIT81_00885 [Deltaproteobacteria bacterium]